jgi:NAD(P)-dependent dehydrogenase (short-subunit alcohol dehydrogenase family)
MAGSEGRLAGKVALISGTGGGQGRVAAEMFARAGAAVVGCDIDGKAEAETARLMSEAGLDYTSVAPLDLSTPDGGKRWVDAAIDRHGRVDLLYNNASTPRFGPFPDVPAEDFRATLDNELNVMWFPTQAVWPHFVAQGGGAILNVGSIAGVAGIRQLPQSAHAASKGAVIGLTPQLAAEGAPHGIRVNCVSPGVISSPPVRELLALGEQSPLRAVIGATATGTLGEPEDVVYAAMYLLSDEAKWVSGAHLVIDGGASVLI